MIAPHEVIARWQDHCGISCFQQPERRQIGLNSRLEIPLFAVAAQMIQMRLAQKMRRNTLGFIDLTFYKAILGIPVTPEWHLQQ